MSSSSCLVPQVRPSGSPGRTLGRIAEVGTAFVGQATSETVGPRAGRSGATSDDAAGDSQQARNQQAAKRLPSPRRSVPDSVEHTLSASLNVEPSLDLVSNRPRHDGRAGEESRSATQHRATDECLTPLMLRTTPAWTECSVEPRVETATEILQAAEGPAGDVDDRLTISSADRRLDQHLEVGCLGASGRDLGAVAVGPRRVAVAFSGTSTAFGRKNSTECSGFRHLCQEIQNRGSKSGAPREADRRRGR